MENQMVFGTRRCSRRRGKLQCKQEPTVIKQYGTIQPKGLTFILVQDLRANESLVGILFLYPVKIKATLAEQLTGVQW